MRTTGLCLFLVVQLHLAAQPMTTIDWVADIDFMAKELPEKHCNFYSKRDKNEWLTSLEQLKASGTKSDFENAMRLQQIVASFGDSHTNIGFTQLSDRNKQLPLYLYWFSDGIYVIETTRENGSILGKRIVGINGVPLETVIDSLSTLVVSDNEAIIKGAVPKFLPRIEILEAFGFVKDTGIELTLKDTLGVVSKYEIEPSTLTTENRQQLTTKSIALCNKDRRAFFVDYYLDVDKIYYLQYNKCSGREVEMKKGTKDAAKLPSFEEFESKVFQTLEDKQVTKIVFDMRYNEGGSSAQGTAFAHKMAKFLSQHQRLKLYVVIGRNTFSSAILNAMDFKSVPNVIFAGEKAAGTPNHFGEVRSFSLPSSALRVNYSTKYFKRTNDKSNTIALDWTQGTSFLDFYHGIDPVYEWIRKQ